MARERALTTIILTEQPIDVIFSNCVKTIKNDQSYINYGGLVDSSQLDVIVRRYGSDYTVRIFHYSRQEFLEAVNPTGTVCSFV